MTIELLADIRGSLKYLPYTPEQRKNHALSILNAMKCYVNRESKIKHYCGEYPDIDPIPRAQNLYDEAHLLSDNEFQIKAMDLFQSLRDFHTIHLASGTFRITFAHTALSFKMVDSEDLIINPKVVVSGFCKYQKVLDLSPESEKATIGDELVAIDGLSFSEYYSLNKWTTGGANEYGGMISAIAYMEMRKFSRHPVPESDYVVYQLKNPSGELYTVSVPWVARYDPKEYQLCNEILLKLGESPVNYRNEDDRLVKDELASKSPVALNDTAIPFIKWAIYKPESFNLGIIQIEAFMFPSAKGQPLIANLLRNQLAKTKALVIDLRGNTGGDGSLSGILAKMFVGGEILGNQSRCIANEITEKFLKDDYSNTDWTGEGYSSIYDMMTPPYDVGQEYFKPVGLFLNGECYSACESIASAIQNNEAAFIFGEDDQTGGGGARPMMLGMLHGEDPEDFPVFPIDGKYKPFVSDFSVGIQQTLRRGRYEGESWEDNGVQSDMILRPKTKDVITGNKYGRFDEVAQKLNELSVDRNLENVSFSTQPSDIITTEWGTDVVFEVTVTGISKLSIFGKNAKEIHTHKIEPVNQPKTLKITVKEKNGKLGYYMYNFKGEDESGKVVIDAVRVVRFVPPATNELSPSLFYVENQEESIPKSYLQWQKSDGQWSVGPGFENGANTSLVLRSSPIENSTVVLSIKYVLDCNALFNISYIDQEGEKSLQTHFKAANSEGSFKFKPIGSWELKINFRTWKNSSCGKASIERLLITQELDQ